MHSALVSTCVWLSVQVNQAKLLAAHFYVCTIKNNLASCIILYSWKIWRGIKFGGLAVCMSTAKLKSKIQNFLLAYIRMAIPYQTAKFKSTNTFAMAIWDPTAKFNSRQYFRLYSSLTCKNVSLVFTCYALFKRGTT